MLLALGVIPRIVNHTALSRAAQERGRPSGRSTSSGPLRAPVAGLTLAATTQAMPDAVVYARTSGYVRKRYVDIGDRVQAGQLMAEIESPEVDQQLLQARADLAQSERNVRSSEGQPRPGLNYDGALQGRRC